MDLNKIHYSNCLKAIVTDGTTTASITCFSDEANTLTRDWNDVLPEITEKNPYQLPASLKALEGTTHTFQSHFDIGSTSKKPDFVLDQVFGNRPLPLPAPAPTQAALP